MNLPFWRIDKLELLHITFVAYHVKHHFFHAEQHFSIRHWISHIPLTISTWNMHKLHKKWVIGVPKPPPFIKILQYHSTLTKFFLKIINTFLKMGDREPWFLFAFSITVVYLFQNNYNLTKLFLRVINTFFEQGGSLELWVLSAFVVTYFAIIVILDLTTYTCSGDMYKSTWGSCYVPVLFKKLWQEETYHFQKCKISERVSRNSTSNWKS